MHTRVSCVVAPSPAYRCMYLFEIWKLPFLCVFACEPGIGGKVVRWDKKRGRGKRLCPTSAKMGGGDWDHACYGGRRRYTWIGYILD